MNPLWLLLPPIVFGIVLLAVSSLSWILSKVAFHRKGPEGGLTKPYACGEDFPDQMVQPDYSRVFPFALFFTILHVVALMVTTVPKMTATTLIIALAYVLGGVVGLHILYRR